MNDKTKIYLGIIMIVVGSLVIQDRHWEDKSAWMVNLAENQAGAKLRTELYREYENRLNPPVFDIATNGYLTSVSLHRTDIILFQSISAAQAVQWAIDNIPEYTSIVITEIIVMDGSVNWFSGSSSRSYVIIAKGGHLDFTQFKDTTTPLYGENDTNLFSRSHLDLFYKTCPHITGHRCNQTADKEIE